MTLDRRWRCVPRRRRVASRPVERERPSLDRSSRRFATTRTEVAETPLPATLRQPIAPVSAQRRSVDACLGVGPRHAGDATDQSWKSLSALPQDPSLVEGIEAARHRSRRAADVDPARQLPEVDHDRDTDVVDARAVIPAHRLRRRRRNGHRNANCDERQRTDESTNHPK